jgi:hypothetical protein
LPCANSGSKPRSQTSSDMNDDTAYRQIHIAMLGVICAFLWLVLDRLDLIIKLMKGSQSN